MELNQFLLAVLQSPGTASVANIVNFTLFYTWTYNEYIPQKKKKKKDHWLLVQGSYEEKVLAFTHFHKRATQALMSLGPIKYINGKGPS
jgi:hypothetical protein